jgi:hypothetical protein
MKKINKNCFFMINQKKKEKTNNGRSHVPNVYEKHHNR